MCPRPVAAREGRPTDSVGWAMSDRLDALAREHITEEWYERIVTNCEICTHCFDRIRHVGELVEREMTIHSHEVNRYYERDPDAETGRDPHSAASERYTSTWCGECGRRNGRADEATRSYADLRPALNRLVAYTRLETPLAIDAQRLIDIVNGLKTGSHARDLQGRDDVIVGVAWCRSTHGDDEDAGSTGGQATDRRSAPLD